jgi:hypothetical protein
MRSTESIVEEYRNADLEKRLYLFLECPALRAKFTEIDQSENATARPVEYGSLREIQQGERIPRPARAGLRG